MTLSTETIEWQDGVPDADTSILVNVEGMDEPVHMGFWDGEDFCIWMESSEDIENSGYNSGATPIERSRVIAWAHIPGGVEPKSYEVDLVLKIGRRFIVGAPSTEKAGEMALKVAADIIPWDDLLDYSVMKVKEVHK